MEAWGIPALNTLILLTSGATVTWAHWGLLKNNRSQLIWGLVMTVLLGMMFISFQVYEYAHAYSELNLKLTMGAYGATFFMLTGFHGFHVTVGTIMLIVILFPQRRGPFPARASLRFRRRGLVLALRRRRLARAVYLRLLAISRLTQTPKKTNNNKAPRTKRGIPVSRERAPHRSGVSSAAFFFAIRACE